MVLDVVELSVRVIEEMRLPVERIARRDRDLGRQIRRAAASVALNLAEGRARSGADRAHAFRIARGSAGEVRVALRVARAWGYTEARAVGPIDAILDRICAMCWRLERS